VEEPKKISYIPEAFLEHRQLFPRSWVNQWVIPNPFISGLHEALSDYDVVLSDFAFAKDAANVGDTALNLLIRKLNAGIKIGLDSISFTVANPNWADATGLSTALERTAEVVHRIVGDSPRSQETTLAFHVVAGSTDLTAATAELVNTALFGQADFYGVSINRHTGQLLIEKSVKYENAAFVRVQHRFSGGEAFSVIADKMYGEQLFSLQLLKLIEPEQTTLS